MKKIYICIRGYFSYISLVVSWGLLAWTNLSVNLEHCIETWHKQNDDDDDDDDDNDDDDDEKLIKDCFMHYFR